MSHLSEFRCWKSEIEVAGYSPLPSLPLRSHRRPLGGPDQRHEPGLEAPTSCVLTAIKFVSASYRIDANGSRSMSLQRPTENNG